MPGALRRRLHRADVHQRVAALGRGRDHRQEERPLPLHDDSKLGEQHLQPGNEACCRLRRRSHEWIDGNLGSHLTMKYPAVYMMEPGARGEVLSIAFASRVNIKMLVQNWCIVRQIPRPHHQQEHQQKWWSR